MELKIDDIQKGERGIRKRVWGLKVLSALEAVGLGTLALVLVWGTPEGSGKLDSVKLHLPWAIHGLFSVMSSRDTFGVPPAPGNRAVAGARPAKGSRQGKPVSPPAFRKKGPVDQTWRAFIYDTPQVMARHLPVFRKEGGAALAAGELVLAENYVIHRETGSAHPTFLRMLGDLNREKPGSPAYRWLQKPERQEKLAKMDLIGRVDVPFGEQVAREKMLKHQNVVAAEEQRTDWEFGTAAALLLFMLSKIGLWRSMEKRAERLPRLLEEVRGKSVREAHGGGYGKIRGNPRPL